MKISAINTNYSFTSIPCLKENKGTEKKNTVDNSVVFNYLNSLGGYNIAFQGKKVPLYAIDENGDYQKFSGRAEAAKELNLSPEKVSTCLCGYRDKVEQYTFMKASDVETTDENGNTIVDEDKINARLQEIKQKDPQASHKRQIYSIDKDGNYKKYNSLTDAANELGLSVKQISSCANGQQKTTGGYGFMHAKDLEKVTPKGNIRVDKKKLRKKTEEIAKVVSEYYEKRPFYAVDKDGNYQRFENNQEACKAIDISTCDIRGCLDGKVKTLNGYALVYADDVEEIDEDGNVTVKIVLPADTFGGAKTPIPIYSIDKNARIKRFPSVTAAADYYSASRRHINSCITGERETTNGLAFIKADGFEMKTSTGKRAFNAKLLNEKFQQVIKNAIYVVDKNGNYQRYESNTEAAKALNVEAYQVKACALGTKKGLNSGHTIVKAQFVESLENGEVVINEKLIQQMAKQAAELEEKEIWAIDTDGHRKKYRSREEASKELGIPIKAINRCLTGKSQSTAGYKFNYVKTKEEKEKILEAQKAAREQRKADADKIYAMRLGSDILEFKNAEEAAENLGLSEEEITYFLKNGRELNGKDSLRGYVFATEEDK